MNEFGLKFFGYTAQELIGKNVIGTTIPEKDDEGRDLAAMVQEIPRHPEKYQTNVHKNMRKNGELVWVSWTNNVKYDQKGNTLEILAIGNDISRLKEAQLRIEESGRRFELLARTASELLQSQNPQKLVESLCRDVMQRLNCHAFFNFLIEEFAGKLHLNAWAGIPEEEAKRIEWLDYGVTVCGCVARDGRRIVAEHIQTTPDERTQLVKSYGIKAYACHPLLADNGEIMGTLSFGTKSRETFSDDDLSLMKAVADQVAIAMDRIRHEREIERIAAQSRLRAEQLAAANKELESFSYSVSHDLRAPIRAMKGFSDILLEDYADKIDSQGQDFLKRIVSGVDKANELIDDMLSLSRISRQEMVLQEIDLGLLAESIVNELRQDKPERKVKAIIGKELKTHGDERLLKIALANLIGNAWKYTGKIEQARMEIGSTTKDGRMVFFVRDNGAGFDMAYAGKLFMPFQRLHSDMQFPGTGIGLAIVERVVKRHGGEIWAEGEVGKGAVFYFTLG
jgi:PAS domain S-box-containing protein